jgi:hypothetical protein
VWTAESVTHRQHNDLRQLQLRNRLCAAIRQRQLFLSFKYIHSLRASWPLVYTALASYSVATVDLDVQ